MRNFRTEKELKDKLVGRIKFQIVVDLKCFDIVSPAKIPDKNTVMLLYLSLSCHINPKRNYTNRLHQDFLFRTDLSAILLSTKLTDFQIIKLKNSQTTERPQFILAGLAICHHAIISKLDIM